MCVSVPNAAGVHEDLWAPYWGPELEPQTFPISYSIEAWKYNFGLIYIRWVPQNKQIAASKGTRIDHWMVQNFVNFKNGLTYPNKKAQFFIYLLKRN